MYKFTKIDDDTTELKFKDKAITIKRNIEILSELQTINFRAKARMMSELKKMGLTVNDLKIVHTEGNKTIEDNSQLVELEKDCLGIEAQRLYNDIIEKLCNMSLVQLFEEVGISLDNEKEITKFTTELNKAIVGTPGTPSQE